MNTAAHPPGFNPPEDRRWGGPLTLALAAHGLLVAALTWGVGWKPDATEIAVEAELWSRLPQEAAPRLQAPEPPPPAPPPPAPAPRPAPPAPAPAPSQADIALEAKKKADEKRKAEAKLAAEKEKKQREAREREEQRKLEEKKLAEQKKREQAKAEAERKKREAAEDKKREAQREAQLAADRQKNLERMMGQAGATGSASARGTAQQASGPSASYGGRVAARIKPNIVFTDTVAGNPRAEVEIKLLPDGSIVASKLTQSSGNRAWDEAVLRAVERTATLPRDENGRVPPTIVLGFRPLD